MKSKLENPVTIFPVRTKKLFVELCRHHSDKFSGCHQSKSAAHFLKQAAKFYLVTVCLVPKKYVESIL